MLVWLAMVTGARRGELCALRWDCVDFTTGVLQIRTSIAQQGATTWEKDTKTHVHRAFATLKFAGLIDVTRGKRAVVSPVGTRNSAVPELLAPSAEPNTRRN